MFISSYLPPVLLTSTQTLLEGLPTVGDVTVTRGPAPTGSSNGFTWSITFETQTQNIELIVVDGNTTAIPIAGPNINIAVVEVRRGVAPSLDIPVTGLEPGTTYFTRVSAINADGYGPTTLAGATEGGARGGNNDGLGIAPLAVVPQTAPGAPVISDVNPVSASELKVELEPVPYHGVSPLGVKVRKSTERWCLRLWPYYVYQTGALRT